jgi:phage gp29-like protein
MDWNLKRMISDRFGRFIGQPDSRTLGQWTTTDSVRDRVEMNNVLSEVTPARIVSIFREADEGIIGPQIELAETIEERDGHIQNLYRIRRQAVCGLEWIIESGDESGISADAAGEFGKVWDRIDSQSILNWLLDALCQQWAFVETRWERTPRRWTPVAVRQGDARRLVWPMVDPRSDEQSAAIPGISLDWSLVQNVGLKPGQHVVHTFGDKHGRPGRGAPVRAVAFMWMLKRFAMIDFGQLVEQFGRPWRVIKYSSPMPDEQITKMLGVIRRAAADMAVAVPKEAEVQLVQGMASGSEGPHTALVRVCNEENSKAIIGSTTISDAAGNNDAVSSPTHSAISTTIRNADAISLAASIRRDLIGPWTLWNFGPDCAAPMLTPVLGEKPDPAKRGLIYETAARLNLQVNSKQLYSELGLERPEGVEEVITLQAPQAAAGFGLPSDGGIANG